MPDDIAIKICGLSTPSSVAAAVEAGARYIGFVFFPKSPRNISIQDARSLALTVPAGVCKVGLFVDPDDKELAAVLDQVPLDMIQLHGTESPNRVAQVRTQFGLPVMKAVAIGDAADLEKLTQYGAVSDQLLVDAKPPKESDIPGGNGVPFDWRLIQNQRWAGPWMLSGGLTIENAQEAIRLTGARQIDLSSGVERERGVKDDALIKDFIATVLR